MCGSGDCVVDCFGGMDGHVVVIELGVYEVALNMDRIGSNNMDRQKIKLYNISVRRNKEKLPPHLDPGDP